VDELLQASTKDRREIFDEAAGISRFKAKKNEALRKLVAVEQNLTRSKDRLDTLDSQLRALRLQAAKAQRHKEYADRLRDLRVGLGVREYSELTVALDAELLALSELRAEVGGASTRTAELEHIVREWDRELGQAEESLRYQEGRLAEARQQIIGYDATLKHERAAATGYEAELLRVGRQRAELGLRVRGLEADFARATAEAATTEEQLRTDQDRATVAAASLATASGHATELAAEYREAGERQFALIRESTAARSKADSGRDNVQRLQNEYTRKLREIDQQSARRAALETALDGLSRTGADLQARLIAARERLTALFAERDQLQQAQDRRQETLADLRVRQGDLRGRIEVLEKLEQSLEGIGAGVREVLRRISAGTGEGRAGALSAVVGLVADLLTVPRDVAPLIELALGDAAQRFVVRDAAAVDAVAAAVSAAPGRVGLVPLLPPKPSPAFATLATHVRCDHPDAARLPDQLLGHWRSITRRVVLSPVRANCWIRTGP
jgi:chromosome segregation protein